MLRVRQNTSDLLSAFRESRQQVQQSVNDSVKPVKQKPVGREVKKKGVTSDKYGSFLNKYEDLENTIESFNTFDLMYLYREKARESNYNYVISNMKRDMGIFKKVQDNYTAVEICLMIEFLFTSNQNYLNTSDLQPTILVSTWCNTIYSDSLLWAKDKYIPKKTKVDRHVEQIQKREWKSTSKVDNAVIGEWE